MDRAYHSQFARMLPRFFAFSFLPTILFAAACATEKKPPPEAPPSMTEGKPLDEGQKVKFEFDGDSQWHVSPYLAFLHHRLKITPEGAGLVVPPDAIQFRVGRMDQILGDRAEFTVTEPGTIAFKLDQKKTAGYKGKIEVGIERLPELKRP